MSHALILILKITACLAAGLCFYVSIFLYEDKEKRIQNTLEDLWIRIDDTQNQALSKHTAFMRTVAGIMTRGFDYVFGDKLLSLQAIGVTLCFSNAWVSIGAIALAAKFNKTGISFYGESFSALFSLFYGLLPTYLSRGAWYIRWVKWQWVWGLGLIYMLFSDYVSPALYFGYILLAYGDRPSLVVLPALFLLLFAYPMFLFVAFTILMRFSMKKIASAKSLGKVALIYLLNCVPFVTFGSMLWGWIFKVENFDIGLMDIFFLVLIVVSVTFNLLFVITTTMFILLATTLLLHRLLWPLLARPTYALQRYGIAKRSKLLGTVGLLLLYAAFGKVEWLEKVIDKLYPH